MKKNFCILQKIIILVQKTYALKYYFFIPFFKISETLKKLYSVIYIKKIFKKY